MFKNILSGWKYIIPIAVTSWSIMGALSCILKYMEACIALTYTGSGPMLIALVAVLIKLGGYKWLRLSIGLLSASVVNVLLKILINAPRPPMEEWIVSAEGPGFPSGHAAITAAFWTIIYMGTRSRVLLIAGIIHVASVSLSRVELGVHYLIDVIGGALQGFIVTYTILTFIDKFNNIYKIEYYIITILMFTSFMLFVIDPSLKTPIFLFIVSIMLLILLYRIRADAGLGKY